MSATAADQIDEALEQLLRGVAEESAHRRAAEQQAADAVERMNQMERDCAKAMLQTCALAENRIGADREEAEQRGRLVERVWVQGLIDLVLNGLQEQGAAAASLQSLRRMVEQGPIKIDPCAGEVS
jgi:hypothetical protein